MKKNDKKWVMLCSTAVAAVYAAGLYTTDSQAAIGQQPPQHIVSNVQTNKNSVNGSIVSKGQTSQNPVNGSTVSKVQTSQNSVNGSTVSKVQTNQMYKDGTFAGQGWNRRGTIDVKVTLKSDKITDVQISDFAMHYSESDVVGLPGEVLQNQSARVNNVSGATYSTAAFQDAVKQALDSAKNA